MTSEAFEAGGWIERLARALNELSEAQFAKAVLTGWLRTSDRRT